MPKLIDHDAYRRELARKAAPLFSEHGYSGLGMRRIADDLGISKSALYHYFPTKKDLFLACTESVMSDTQAAAATGQRDQDPADRLIAFARELEPGFAREMSLLFDYLRGRTQKDIAADEAMRMANAHLRRQVEALTGPADCDAVLCLLMGTLLMRHFSGGRLDFDLIRPLLAGLPEK